MTSTHLGTGTGALQASTGPCPAGRGTQNQQVLPPKQTLPFGLYQPGTDTKFLTTSRELEQSGTVLNTITAKLKPEGREETVKSVAPTLQSSVSS